ncbi:MAG: acetyl-CoA carboxylase, carboxyltransferase subunit beta [Verrucomicrobiota bacterium]|nr:acetyl-CoA carboxylase, carboxyltransferase subunit beta [Verrucomicrobiota bacterium]
MAFFSKPKYSTVATNKKKDIPKGIFGRCPISGEILYNKELEKNFNVVTKSGYHFPLSAPRRVELLIDPGTFQEMDSNLQSVDAIDFSRHVNYLQKLERDKQKTGLDDAIISGLGQIAGIEVSLAVLEFNFLGGSMGSVVGEKVTRAIERATAKKLPVIIVAGSGGARMHEGVLSLMQMAKTSAALARHADADLPFISILTDPTYGGVTASFAVLGDIILAEPGAHIGFAGPRVIKEGTGEILPEGFQTAEFLLKHGLIDQIVPRLELRQRLIVLLHAIHLKKAVDPQKVDGRKQKVEG